MSNIIEPQILPSNQGSFVTKDSNGNIVETKPTSTWFSEFIKSNTGVVGGSDFAPKPQKPNQQQAVLQAKSFEKLTAEDRLYEKLGIKYHNTHMFGVASRLKGRLLLAVILISTYFAYKKIK